MILRKRSKPESGRKLLKMETLESRRLLASYPAYVDGVFTFGQSTGAPYPLDDTFQLESVPGADKTIYLDYDGHHSVGNSWNHNIVFPPFNRSGSPSTFSDSELIEIQQQWQNVAEDFLPFNINVTTKDPGVEALRRSPSNDTVFGVRVVATQATGGFGNGIGGVAFLNSFNDTIDNPVFAFNKGSRNGGMTASHEVGHALGLSHDGLFSQSYHPGTGSGPTGWGPLMGAPFGKPITHWSRGEYNGATTTEDDLGIMTRSANGFTYRTDDFGNSTATAHELTPSNGALFEWGIVERNTDSDFFEFSTEAGQVSLDILTFAQDSNLDILAKLYDSNGTVLAESNALASRNATFNETLDAGTYFVSVEGTGRPDRYTEYGSLGFYSVSGTIVDGGVIDGDFNDDGLWNEVDIDQLIADIAGPGTPDDYDLTGDGVVDLADRDAWLAEAGGINLASGNAYLLGDLDLNGVVDGVDFIAWNNNKFTSVAAWSAGDINADSFVDGIDFTIWNDHKFMSSDALTLGDEGAIDVDPLGEAPFWPLGQDQRDGHDHDAGFHSDVFPEDFDFPQTRDVTSIQATGSVLEPTERFESSMNASAAGQAATRFQHASMAKTMATTRAVPQTGGQFSPTIVDDAFRLL